MIEIVWALPVMTLVKMLAVSQNLASCLSREHIWMLFERFGRVNGIYNPSKEVMGFVFVLNDHWWLQRCLKMLSR